LIGLVAAFLLMIFGMVFDANTFSFNFSAVTAFVDVPSLLITFGGAFMATMAMSDSPGTFVKSLKTFTLTLKSVPLNEEETIKSIIDLSNIARKEGLLALEEAAGSIEDDFMKKGVLFIVDGTDPELVRSIMETELACIETRHKGNVGFWENLGSMGPAWGMIGTLIGLINMLGNLSDIAAVGPNMAIALITTFYGSLLANWICTPTSNKLKSNSVKEITAKTIAVEGLLSIQAGENPRIIEEKLKSFISPERRAAISENGGGEGGGE
jgi:chemotaxis protein MotA